jgi:hypothetical protein
MPVACVVICTSFFATIVIVLFSYVWGPESASTLQQIYDVIYLAYVSGLTRDLSFACY